MSFTNDIRNAVARHHATIVAAEQARIDFQEKNSAIYSREEFNRRMGELTAARDEAISAGNSAIRSITQNFVDSIATIDNLDGEKLTADAKLLESAIPLTKEDLTGIFDRSQGNRTMQQLVIRRAKTDGIYLDRVFYDRQQIEDAARTLERAAFSALPAGVYFDYTFGNDANFKKIIPEPLKSL